MATTHDPKTPRYPLPDTPFYRTMAFGHHTRKGHPLKGYLVMDGGFARLVRTCCN